MAKSLIEWKQQIEAAEQRANVQLAAAQEALNRWASETMALSGQRKLIEAMIQEETAEKAQEGVRRSAEAANAGLSTD